MAAINRHKAVKNRGNAFKHPDYILYCKPIKYLKMKNSILIAVVSVLCLGSVACQKKYTCQCISGTAEADGQEFEVNSVSKDDAETKCTRYQEQIKGLYNTTAYECKIK